jgi:hypothetical protein
MRRLTRFHYILFTDLFNPEIDLRRHGLEPFRDHILKQRSLAEPLRIGDRREGKRAIIGDLNVLLPVSPNRVGIRL